MFCSNCGAKAKDNAKFCEACGSALRQPKGASSQGTQAGGWNRQQVKVSVDKIKQALPVKKTKKWKAGLIGIAAAVAVIIVAVKAPHISFEECDWCGAIPTLAYDTSEGESYVCGGCRRECFWCGERATRHYENALGIMTFVCGDCYYDLVVDEW